jgi:hypothetical protein
MNIDVTPQYDQKCFTIFWCIAMLPSQYGGNIFRLSGSYLADANFNAMLVTNDVTRLHLSESDFNVSLLPEII